VTTPPPLHSGRSPEPRRGTRGGLYLFLGPDRPRKLQRVQALERSLGIQPFDRHQLDASALTPPALLALCRQQPAMSPLRFIVVDQAHRLERESVQALLQHAEAMTTVACVILLVETELGVRHPLTQATVRPADGGAVMTVESFPRRDTPATKPFALTDALGNRDVAGALIAAHDQLLVGKDPLELLGLIAWQLNRWVTVRRLLSLSYTAERISTVMGVRPWQVERVQSEVAGRSLTDLHGLLATCWQLDVEAKSGRTIPQLAIEQLIADVCGRVAKTISDT